jgi:hypothetical protein
MSLKSISPLAPLEEHVGSAIEWPVWLRELALKESLDHQDRFTFLINFLGNVAPPFATIEHMLPKLKDVDALRDTMYTLAGLRNGTTSNYHRLM